MAILGPFWGFLGHKIAKLGPFGLLFGYVMYFEDSSKQNYVSRKIFIFWTKIGPKMAILGPFWGFLGHKIAKLGPFGLLFGYVMYFEGSSKQN